MSSLISDHEEYLLAKKIKRYYEKLYPSAKFENYEEYLRNEELGDIYYTYPGEEAEITSPEKMKEIHDAIKLGYSTPVIILKKPGKEILLDGHRRIKLAWLKGLGWKAIVLKTKSRRKLGVEDMILGKVKELF